jgi:DNA mismatch repair protein MutL
VEALTVLALARLDVGFTLVSNGRVRVEVLPVAEVGERIAALFDRSLAQQLVPVEHHAGYLSVRGLVQRPADAKPTGRRAFLFVNGRPFRDPFLVRAAEAGYRATIAPGLRPSLFLALELPGDRVDMNVHPAKLEVRFRDKMLVERSVEEAVRAALRPMEAAATVTGAPYDRPTAGPADRPNYPPIRGSADPTEAGAHAVPSLLPETPAADVPGQGPLLQLFNTYILFETPEGLAIVDQHSAHERVLYEQTMAHLSGEGAVGQRLLLPLTVDLAPEEVDAVEAHRDLLAAVGFEVEPFGGSSVVAHAVPNPHPRFDATRCLEDLVADLARGRFGGWTNRLERFAATYGCRAAIKAGQRLETGEMRTLLARLFACELPPHDVHGRPTIVQLPKGELERRFGRA